MVEKWEVHVVKYLIEVENMTYDKAVLELNHMYRTCYAPRTLRLYCKDNNIRRLNPVSKEVLDATVRQSVALAGPYYGRKTLKGKAIYFKIKKRTT